MKYRVLGRTGLNVSEVSFGTVPLGVKNYIEVWDPDDAATQQSIHDTLLRALDLGYNYFDTAASYGEGRSEELLGRMLKNRHDQCYVATKTPIPHGGWANATLDYVLEETEASLKRLQVDYIDVLQVHGVKFTSDERKAVLNVVVPAYLKLKEQGKIRFLGLTNQTSIGVDEFIASGFFDVLQIRYNIIYQEPFDTFLDAAAAQGIGITVNRPMTSGIFQKLMRQVVENIDGVLDLNALCLRFCLSDPRIASAIVGMRRISEVEANLETSQLAQLFDLDFLHQRRV